MALNLRSFIIKGLRSKAFSPVCLFRFLIHSAAFLCCDTVSEVEGRLVGKTLIYV